ncbi:MAG: hypothetical protein A3J62_03780 [Candidatus Buchananbacteria bacterium RIFCSPHIGHO2_02_FULL_38_8]|uniref:Archease domain-containing protein n=2 Tax=Candidatus Buchananiibacteriota TaxID=1817903 RepID=A0A1G1XVT7_9BACT|nr:hypothetical protein [uncultured bacterium]OGY44112.1 MAG: hypothetical protein A2731_02870 [Candidatus Buchananbacteria bacterium RIFCSPHIGHO2_01_FULL_39_8]OGY47564.1 MAG: hypothetical protein A3J62_03780 [Candidatus Buchananbacteria bacterium RIFCSPHIGHO2_02_FULL_38_8]HLC89818.1 archease [Patescibacteria group bacterium]
MDNQGKKFEFLDHPADLKVKVFGQDLTEIFTNAALAMMTYLYPRQVEIKNHEIKKEIKLKARDTKALLVDWLSELLYLSDTADCCFNDFDFNKLDENELQATIFGRRVQAKEDIKAVTYHDLELKQVDKEWQARILFDI